MRRQHDNHRRRSIRLKEYDYAQPGAYFITVCTQNRKCFFGKICECNVKLSTIGEIATRCWFEIPIHFGNVILDKFVMMPDHVHGILFLSGTTDGELKNIEKTSVGVQYIEPLRIESPRVESEWVESPRIKPAWVESPCIESPRRNITSRRINKYQKIIPKSIGSIIRCYKAAVTRWCHRNGLKCFHWQRGFYEHVIRDERELYRIRQYIINNPLKWHRHRNRLGG